MVNIIIAGSLAAQRQRLSNHVQAHPAVAVQVLSSGAAVMQRLSEQTVDLLILDLMLPDLDGFEVLAQMKQERRYREIPVIVYSDSPCQAYLGMAKKLGATAALLCCEPTDYGRLLQAVDEAIGRLRQQSKR